MPAGNPYIYNLYYATKRNEFTLSSLFLFQMTSEMITPNVYVRLASCLENIQGPNNTLYDHMNAIYTVCNSERDNLSREKQRMLDKLHRHMIEVDILIKRIVAPSG